jgi:hypothetical protein
VAQKNKVGVTFVINNNLHYLLLNQKTMDKIEELAKAEEWKVTEKRYFNQIAKLNPEISSIRYTENRYDRYDVAFRSGSTIGLGEIKIRKKDLSFFQRPGNYPYLEHQKYVALLQVRQEILLSSGTDCSLYYIHNTKDYYCQLYQLNLDRRNYNWVERLLPVDDFNPYIKEWKIVHELKEPLQLFRLF